MTGLVLELQREALDKTVTVSDLLRKALVVSRKLGIDSINEWLSSELNGYDLEKPIPEYREITGQVLCFNPYRGWVPLEFGDPNLARKLSTRKINQAIGQLVSLVREGDSSSLQVPFSHEVAARLRKGMEYPMEPSLHVDGVAVVGILEAVRNQVLEWALQLEAEGVIGEGMTFTAKERNAAQSITYNVTHIEEMTNSQLQQGTSESTQTVTFSADVETIRQTLAELKAGIDGLALDAAEADQLAADIDTAITQANSPKPNRSIISESLRSIRVILEGAASSVLGNQILQQIGRWMIGG